MSTSELCVRVRTPSRLHFGLLAFGDAAPRQFGGVGIMIERPETELTLDFSSDPKRVPNSSLEQRALEYVERFEQTLEPEERQRLPRFVRVRVDKAPPEHVGLGSGTQLAMAVSRAMATWSGKSSMSPDELARRVGRGTRSAIGIHGFNQGGFLVEGGKRDASSVSPLVARLNFPDEWHFVLIIPNNAKGLHGAAEGQAFNSLAPIEQAVTAELCRLTLLGLLPAVAERDFAAFSDSLFEFGQTVGKCFAAMQGGVYSSPLAGEIVAAIRRQGVRGIAQSSWGPTLSAVTESRFRAEWLAARLADTFTPDTAQILCTPANNLGARMEVVTANPR